MYNGPSFWRHKNGCRHWEKLEIKESKKNLKKKKKKTFLLLLYCAILKNVLYCNYISGKSNFKKNIFLPYHSTSFCPQSSLMTSKLHLRELNIKIHLWDVKFFDNFYGFGSLTGVFKVCIKGETFRKKFRETLNSVSTINKLYR